MESESTLISSLELISRSRKKWLSVVLSSLLLKASAAFDSLITGFTTTYFMPATEIIMKTAVIIKSTKPKITINIRLMIPRFDLVSATVI